MLGALACEDLRGVVRVGYNYGGMVIAAVAELLLGRLKRCPLAPSDRSAV